MQRTPPADVTTPLSWGCCKSEKEGDNYIQCRKCMKAYHRECLSLEETATDADWLCILCIPKKGKSDSTPVRPNQNVTVRPSKRPAVNSPPEIGDVFVTKGAVLNMVQDMLQGKSHADKSIVTPEKVTEIVQEVVQKELQVFVTSLTSKMSTLFSPDLKSIKEEINDVKQSMSFIDSQYEDFIKEHKAAMETMKILKEENQTMRSTISDLSSRLNQVEQQARSSNIELQCVPEKKDENLINLVSQLGETIECHVTDNDIPRCTRVAKFNNNSSRPRSIIVQFVSPKLRDSFLAASITFNKAKKDPKEKINASHLGLRESSPVFVVEHLSSVNKALHGATRLRAKEKGYKYVWIRSGRIFVRKSDNEPHIYIRDSSSLDFIV